MKRGIIRIFSILLSIFSLYLGILLFLEKGLCPLRGILPSSDFPSPPILAIHGESFALPVFARKYETSCQTCHTAFPNLTPFGDAFKRNGFRFPGEGTTFESPDSMPLGKEEDKKDFPKAIWPGAIPKSIPISVSAESDFVSQPKDNVTHQKASFNQFGGNLGIFSAGTVGKHFGFFGGVEFEANVDLNSGERSFDVSVDRVYVLVNPLATPKLVIKIGSFEPHLLGVSEHRSLLGGYFAITDLTIGDNLFTLEPSQQGIEVGGSVVNGRLGYTAGVVEGTGNHFNNWKDFYGRMEYKIGGLRLDGVQDDHSSTIKRPWQDDSTLLGIFGYQGFATVTSAITSQEDRFEIFGADATFNYANFIAYLSYIRNQNNRPILADPNRSLGTNQIIADINYVWYWFIPGFRYEFFDNQQTNNQRITLGSTFLIRPNIKGFLRGSLTKLGSSGFTDNPEIDAGLKLAF